MTQSARPNRLKAIRNERRLTALQVATALGVREVTVYRYESGDNIPPLATMHRLAEILDATLDELFPAQEASA